MAKNDWARNAFRKAQNLMSRGYNDFEPATVVTKNDLSNLKNTLLDDDEILKQNTASWTNMEQNPYGVDANPIMEAADSALSKAGVATPYAWTEDSTIEEITQDAEDSLKKKYDIDQPEDPNKKNSFFGEWWDNFVDKVVPDMGMGEDDDQRIAVAVEAITKLQRELNNLPTNTTPLTKQEREAVTKKRNQLKSQITEIKEKKQSYLREGAFYRQDVDTTGFETGLGADLPVDDDYEAPTNWSKWEAIYNSADAPAITGAQAKKGAKLAGEQIVKLTKDLTQTTDSKKRDKIKKEITRLKAMKKRLSQ